MVAGCLPSGSFWRRLSTGTWTHTAATDEAVRGRRTMGLLPPRLQPLSGSAAPDVLLPSRRPSGAVRGPCPPACVPHTHPRPHDSPCEAQATAGGPRDSIKAGGEVGNLALQSGERGPLGGALKGPAWGWLQTAAASASPHRQPDARNTASLPLQTPTTARRCAAFPRRAAATAPSATQRPSSSSWQEAGMGCWVPLLLPVRCGVGDHQNLGGLQQQPWLLLFICSLRAYNTIQYDCDTAAARVGGLRHTRHQVAPRPMLC